MRRPIRFAAIASVLAVGPAVAEPRAASDVSVSVSADKRGLLIKRPSDRQPILVPVLDRCGNPAVGELRIRSVRRSKEVVTVTYGKHCSATVSLRTLVVECAGCD